MKQRVVTYLVIESSLAREPEVKQLRPLAISVEQTAELIVEHLLREVRMMTHQVNAAISQHAI